MWIHSGCIDFWKYILRGSVATQLRCGGIFSNNVIANVLFLVLQKLNYVPPSREITSKLHDK